jgi:hypothetical protein
MSVSYLMALAGNGMSKRTSKPSELQLGKKLNQPGPLYKKLELSVVEEERTRLGK